MNIPLVTSLSILKVLSMIIVLAFPARLYALDALEQQIDKTIRDACYGYVVEMLPEALRSIIYKNSDTCKAVVKSDGDVAQALKKIGKSSLRDPSRWATLQSDINIDIPCHNEYMCLQIRKMHKDGEIPVSQPDYEAVRDHCKNEYLCIERWFETWPRALPLPDPATPLQVVQLIEPIDELAAALENSTENEKRVEEDSSSYDGLDFGDLMGNPETTSVSSDRPENLARTISNEETPAAIGFDFDDVMSGDNVPNRSESMGAFGEPLNTDKSAAYTSQLTMDDIYSSRTEIKVDDAIEVLTVKVKNITDTCQCLLTKKACFNGPKFSIAGVNKSLRKAENKFNHQQDKICYNWQNVLKGLPRDLDHINETAANAESSLEYFAKLDSQFKDIVKKHRSENSRIEKAKRTAAEKKSGSGFNWGKLAALGVGAAIGGIGNLDSATQLDLISGMVADSAEGVEGTSNFQGNANAALSRLAPPVMPSRKAGVGGGVKAAKRANAPKLKDEVHKFTCSTGASSGSSSMAGTNGLIPSGREMKMGIMYYTEKCKTALKIYVEVKGCNKINENESAAQQCLSACGNRQCLEQPPEGTAVGSGDSDLDFINSMGQ